MRWWAARALFAAGLTRPEGGSPDELLRARARFREMGAEGWQLRVEAELRARGHRIPSRADGRPERPGELSARELEVLDQLAEGLTNREIGDHLFISERTVARHVGKILAKLEVGNRTAAVRAGRQQGLISTERR
jgi:DNA-binding NarL/FixJ family response regulator